MWEIYVVDVKSQQNNLTEVAEKVSNEIFLKQIMENRTKIVTCQKFYMFFLACLNLIMKILQQLTITNITKHWQIEEY